MKKVAEALEGLREEERRLLVELAGVRRAIAALEEVMGIGPALEQDPPPSADTLLPEALLPEALLPTDEAGPYATSGFYEAAAAYLSSAGEPRSAREIAEALLAGGYRTRAKSFTATVRTMLHRTLSTVSYGIEATESGNRWFTRDGAPYGSE